MHRRADGRLLWLRALLRALLPRLLPRLLPPKGEVPVEDPTRWRRSPLRLILESERVDSFDDLDGEMLACNGQTCGVARDKMGAVRLTGATTVDWFNVTRSSSGGSQPGVTSQCESRNVTVGALECWKPTTRERISPSRRALRTYETRGSARTVGETSHAEASSTMTI